MTTISTKSEKSVMESIKLDPKLLKSLKEMTFAEFVKTNFLGNISTYASTLYTYKQYGNTGYDSLSCCDCEKPNFSATYGFKDDENNTLENFFKLIFTEISGQKVKIEIKKGGVPSTESGKYKGDIKSFRFIGGKSNEKFKRYYLFQIFRFFARIPNGNIMAALTVEIVREKKLTTLYELTAIISKLFSLFSISSTYNPFVNSGVFKRGTSVYNEKQLRQKYLQVHNIDKEDFEKKLASSATSCHNYFNHTRFFISPAELYFLQFYSALDVLASYPRDLLESDVEPLMDIMKASDVEIKGIQDIRPFLVNPGNWNFEKGKIVGVLKTDIISEDNLRKFLKTIKN